jgi:hypothetical protein
MIILNVHPRVGGLIPSSKYQNHHSKNKLESKEEKKWRNKSFTKLSRHYLMKSVAYWKQILEEEGEIEEEEEGEIEEEEELVYSTNLLWDVNLGFETNTKDEVIE